MGGYISYLSLDMLPQLILRYRRKFLQSHIRLIWVNNLPLTISAIKRPEMDNFDTFDFIRGF
jgi:hypothetical protein